MATFLMISSRDPFESRDTISFYQTCEQLIDAGSKVILFLVQNGVLPARKSAFSPELERLAGKGVQILADEYALESRGLTHGQLIPSVKPDHLSTVIEHMAHGSKVVWH